MMADGAILRDDRFDVLVKSYPRRSRLAVFIAPRHSNDNRHRDQRAGGDAQPDGAPPKNHFTSAIKHPIAGPPAAGAGLPATIASSARSRSRIVGASRALPKSTYRSSIRPR